MRTLRRHIVPVIFVLFVASACAKVPPNITPQAVVAFHQTQVYRVLDQVRDVAESAHRTVPPLISAQVDLKIVTWHESAVNIAHAAKAGWPTVISTSLDELKKDLSPTDWTVIAPYVSLAQTLLKEVR